MKEGHLQESPSLDNIEGIVVPLLNGENFLVYPKYAKRRLLLYEDTEKWTAKEYNEADALYNHDNKNETDILLKLNSPAAIYVRSFGKDLPSLQMLFVIYHNLDTINKLAEGIKGADKLERGSYLWASCRYNSYYAWIFNGYLGYASNPYFYYGYTAVPVALCK